MNTGIRSRASPLRRLHDHHTGGRKREHGCLTQKKSLFDIVAAHRIPYAATASGGVSERLHQESGTSARYQGHPFHPRDGTVSRGLGLPSADMVVDVAREIVDTGL